MNRAGSDERRETAEMSGDQGKNVEGWRRGFDDRPQSAFAQRFADDIVLDATTLAKPVEGKQNVATVLAAASSIYESPEFTAESQTASTTYLQWRATAFGGTQIGGITILERYFIEPTMFTGLDNRSAVAREEIFGPVLTVIAYDDEDDAIRIANDSKYGLGGTVWSPDHDQD
jgi:hypothetical protein